MNARTVVVEIEYTTDKSVTSIRHLWLAKCRDHKEAAGKAEVRVNVIRATKKRR